MSQEQSTCTTRTFDPQHLYDSIRGAKLRKEGRPIYFNILSTWLKFMRYRIQTQLRLMWNEKSAHSTLSFLAKTTSTLVNQAIYSPEKMWTGGKIVVRSYLHLLDFAALKLNTFAANIKRRPGIDDRFHEGHDSHSFRCFLKTKESWNRVLFLWIMQVAY